MKHGSVGFLVIVSGLLLAGLSIPRISAESVKTSWEEYHLDEDEQLMLRMFSPGIVRAPVDINASLEINSSGERNLAIDVRSILISVNGTVIHSEPPFTLFGDTGWYRRFVRTLEEMNPSVSGLYMHRLFVPREQAPGLRGDGDFFLNQAAMEMVEDARADSYFRDHTTINLVDFSIPISELYQRGEFRPGEKIVVTALITLVEENGVRRVRYVHTIDVAEPFPRASVRYWDESGVLHRIPGSWHAGDLHVHYCKDEASLFGERGCPDCQAESLNFGDDNTLNDLKGQYQALGASWFTITSHSYCLEESTEYEQVRAQSEALSDSSFLLIPDTELTSEEEGPQSGGDLGDLVCPNGSNHSGAHFIQSQKPGGQDGFLEVCNDPIYSFLDNIIAIRAEGGFGVVNHPAAATWGWNSIELLPDRDSDGYHGIEIWNGPDGGGQGGNVAFWVDRLLEGKKFYCFSGSDTHDDAFDFGWNHVLITGGLSTSRLKASLKHGRLYVSNYQLLATLVYRQGVGFALMGGSLRVPVNVESVRLFILCDMGTKTGSITVFRGSVGDTEEEVVTTLNGISGYRLIPVEVPVISGTFYLRAYSEVTGQAFYAYTNPIWIERLGSSPPTRND